MGNFKRAKEQKSAKTNRKPVPIFPHPVHERWVISFSTKCDTHRRPLLYLLICTTGLATITTTTGASAWSLAKEITDVACTNHLAYFTKRENVRQTLASLPFANALWRNIQEFCKLRLRQLFILATFRDLYTYDCCVHRWPPYFSHSPRQQAHSHLHSGLHLHSVGVQGHSSQVQFGH